jgi:hypothetical protein
MNKYKATLDKSGTVGGSINGVKPAQPSSKSDVYTFTPQDFKYENKHYKYIKYTKYNKVSYHLPDSDIKHDAVCYVQKFIMVLYFNKTGNICCSAKFVCTYRFINEVVVFRTITIFYTRKTKTDSVDIMKLLTTNFTVTQLGHLTLPFLLQNNVLQLLFKRWVTVCSIGFPSLWQIHQKGEGQGTSQRVRLRL